MARHAHAVAYVICSRSVFLSSPTSNACWAVVCVLGLSQQSDRLSLAAALTMSQIMLKETGNLRSTPLVTK